MFDGLIDADKATRSEVTVRVSPTCSTVVG